MYCRNCGAELQEGQKFCPKCGAPVDQKAKKNVKPEEAEQQIVESQDTQPKKMNTKAIAGIIAAVAAVVIIVITVANTRSSSTEEQVEEESEPAVKESESVEKEEEEKEEEEEEEKEPELSDDEKYALEQEELANNIKLNLEIKSEPIYTSTDAILEYGEREGCIIISGDITNDNDEACSFCLGYDLTETYPDNYGDDTTETKQVTTERIHIAAHDTAPYYLFVNNTESGDSRYECTNLHLLYGKKQGEGGITTCTNEDRTFDEYTNSLTEVGVPLALSDIDVTPDFYIECIERSTNLERVLCDMTLKNNTDAKWEQVMCHYALLYDGEYLSDSTWVEEYLKPGEEVSSSAQLYRGTELSDDFVNHLSIEVEEVMYLVDEEQ